MVPTIGKGNKVTAILSKTIGKQNKIVQTIRKRNKMAAILSVKCPSSLWDLKTSHCILRENELYNFFSITNFSRQLSLDAEFLRYLFKR